jgi:hypothetical protein
LRCRLLGESLWHRDAKMHGVRGVDVQDRCRVAHRSTISAMAGAERNRL